ncbi:hypothetical protein [Lonsdalea quercina]|uniref:hypothetical protein n=1 Tax=Lonsdalea quercina TaxID=71657 RepID=UPI003974D363
MKNIKKIATIALVATTFCTAGAAFAGPPVTVTFKNLGTQEATFKMVTTNEFSSYGNSTPKPKTTVLPQSTDIFIVQSKIIADANAAIIRYTMGSKTCEFSTTFLNQFIGGGLIPGARSKVPKWSKNAISSNGAICTATLKYQSVIDFSWAAEFTMK